MSILSKRERLALILKRLEDDQAAASEADALQLIGRAMDEVEDAHSGVPKDPSHHLSQRTDGRMYPPHERFKLVSPFPNSSCYRQAAHKTYVGTNGSFRIISITATGEQVAKPGADGAKL